MARLPVIGGDEDYWGNVLVEFLEVEHDSDGTHKIRKIRDEDDDTCFETERSADEDIVRAKAGGQDIFEGYNSGIFSLVKQSGACMKLSANQTIPDNTDTKLALDSYEWDNQGEVDTTNNRFTATESGKYLVCGMVNWNKVSGGYRRIRIFINGSIYKTVHEFNISENAYCTLPFSIVVTVNTGDYLEFVVQQTSGGDLSVLSTNTRAIVVKIF